MCRFCARIMGEEIGHPWQNLTKTSRTINFNQVSLWHKKGRKIRERKKSMKLFDHISLTRFRSIGCFCYLKNFDVSNDIFACVTLCFAKRKCYIWKLLIAPHQAMCHTYDSHLGEYINLLCDGKRAQLFTKSWQCSDIVVVPWHLRKFIESGLEEKVP